MFFWSKSKSKRKRWKVEDSKFDYDREYDKVTKNSKMNEIKIKINCLNV